MVELGDGRWVFGWVEFYSDFPNPPSLFLQDACWIEQTTGNRHQVNGAGILITGDVKAISFYAAKDTRQSSASDVPNKSIDQKPDLPS